MCEFLVGDEVLWDGKPIKIKGFTHNPSNNSVKSAIMFWDVREGNNYNIYYAKKPTPQQEPVPDQLIAFVSSMPGVAWEVNGLSVYFTWGITRVCGQITTLPDHKNLRIIPLSHEADIGAGKGASINIKFPRND